MSKKQIFISLIVTIAIFSAVSIAINIILYPMNHYTHEYTDFNNSRIKEVEKTFGITVDNIKLEKYTVRKDRYHEFYTLEINNVSDYEKFMADNVKGSIKTKYKDNVLYDYDENTKTDVSDVGDSIEYTYSFEYTKGLYRDVSVEFIPENNIYSAVIRTEYKQYVDDKADD